jgi:class 3 adenylate cyclase
LVAFSSTSDALAFALTLLEAMAESPLELRIGMAAGEPIREGGDLHGAVVHQASRVADQAGAGEIIVADTVRQLALGKGFAFEPAGEHTLKGFDEPVRLWRVTGF